MNIVLAVLAGLLLGFAPGSGNTTRSLTTALFVGVLFGALAGGACLLGGSGLVIAGCIFGGSIAGSFLAAFTPNDNPIKRYFDLYSNRR